MSPEEWRANYPVRPEFESLLTLGTPLIERDAGEFGSLILADPRQGKGSKYLFPMWEISDPHSLETVVGELITASRTPDVAQHKVENARRKAATAFDKEVAGAPVPGYDFSAERIATVDDFGAMQLEYAAYLTRLEVGMPWGSDEHAAPLLQTIRNEAAARFLNWCDYMISAVAAWDCVDVSFGFPDGPPVYLKLLRLPDSLFIRHPLH
jgi:hypothetical protein